MRSSATSPGPAISLSTAGATLAGAAPTRPAAVWLVRYDPNVVQAPVKRGENTGKTLPHKNVVRELTRIGAWSGRAETFRIPPAAGGLKTAILVQRPGGGAILAAYKE